MGHARRKAGMGNLARRIADAEAERARLDAELAALPRNTRRMIDGRKHRIAGRPGNRHWREVAPARYKGAKR
ncbi:MAG: hypothetical protein KGH75_00440 [Rhodospirillales bacterium]|nr:hypothetical protein [Rhodospirillales bacterium]